MTRATIVNGNYLIWDSLFQRVVESMSPDRHETGAAAEIFISKSSDSRKRRRDTRLVFCF